MIMIDSCGTVHYIEASNTVPCQFYLLPGPCVGLADCGWIEPGGYHSHCGCQGAYMLQWRTLNQVDIVVIVAVRGHTCWNGEWMD